MRIAMLGLRMIGRGSGGVEKAVEEISRRLVARGHEVTVFVRGRYNPERLREYHGVRLVTLPALYTKHLEAISHTALAVVRCLWGYDVVHIHAVGPALLSFLPRVFGRRVVVTVHAMDWRRQKWGPVAKSVLRAGGWAAVHVPHRTIAVSRHLADFCKTTYGKEVTHIPNGVPKAEPRNLASLRRFGLEANAYYLFLGRLVPEKGCHLLVSAFRQLNAENKLLIVGETSHTDAYVTELQRLAGDDSRIVFAGALYGDEKAEAYSNATCLVFPSLLEGMPIVMLEAMSYGCPVLCSDIPENLEIAFADGGDEPGHPLALIFRSGSAEDLLGKLQALSADLEGAHARADRAKVYMDRAFSWDRVAERTETVYRQLEKGEP